MGQRGGGAAGGRDHKNITEPCGKITKILSWHNQNHVNTPSAPLSPPSDIMTGPLARKPRSSNDTTPYIFIYWLVNFFFFCYSCGCWTESFWRWHSAVSQSGWIKFKWPGKGKEKCSTVEKIYLDGKDCSLWNLGYTQWDVSCFQFSRVTIIRARTKGLFATHCTREVTFMFFIKLLSMEV